MGAAEDHLAPLAVRERRRQRAETVGTLLRSATTFVVFGIALLVWPATGILALLWMIGAFSLVTGAVLIGQAFRTGGRAIVG